MWPLVFSRGRRTMYAATENHLGYRCFVIFMSSFLSPPDLLRCEHRPNGVMNPYVKHAQTYSTQSNRLTVLLPHLKEPHEVVDCLCLRHNVERDGVAHRAFHANLPQSDMVGINVVCTDQADTTRQTRRTRNACLETSTHTGPKQYFRRRM